MSDQNLNQDLSSQQTSQDQKKGFSPLVSILGIVVTTSVLFFGGYSYLQYLQNSDIEQTEKTQVEEQIEEEARLNQIKENTKNDQSRKLDLSNLEKGLGDYFEENKKYPEKLEALMPEYLTVIPLDPISKKTYRYESSNDLKSFELSSQLSDKSVYSIKSGE